MKLLLRVFFILFIAMNAHGTKKRIRGQEPNAIIATAQVRYAKDVVLTPQQKKALVAYVAQKSNFWFKSPERFSEKSIRLNEMQVSTAPKNLTGWVVNWKFRFRKSHQSSLWVEDSALDFWLKKQNEQ